MGWIKCARMLNCSAVALKERCQVFVSLCNLTTRASSLCSTSCDSTSCPSDRMLSCIQTFVCWLTSLVSLAAKVTYSTFLSSCSGKTRIHNSSPIHHAMSKQNKLKTGLVYSVPWIKWMNSPSTLFIKFSIQSDRPWIQMFKTNRLVVLRLNMVLIQVGEYIATNNFFFLFLIIQPFVSL